MIRFDDRKNQLLVNPRLSEEEKSVFANLKNEFEKTFGAENYFLVPSSGSSKQAGQSVKLIALSYDSVLNSARRVNYYLNATEKDSWGLCLPEFHVAGLGVVSRAHLSGSEVRKIQFDIKNFSGSLFLTQVSFLSLVPAQIYDLVQAKVQGPVTLKKVFVGGGFLGSGLRLKAEELGWPVVETYGMTETASMIAVREQGQKKFRVMDGVKVAVNDGKLSISCDSLATATVQTTGQVIDVVPLGEWYRTEDEARIENTESGTFLEVQGRKSDYIKISGEGVSLAELRDLLQEIAVTEALGSGQVELIALEDERSGYRIAIVFEEAVSEEIRQNITEKYNFRCRPYEKVYRTIVLRQIPRTELGKLKLEELKHIIKGQV
jgi:O-succinylbenzoic acid--CoA ligase